MLRATRHLRAAQFNADGARSRLPRQADDLDERQDMIGFFGEWLERDAYTAPDDDDTEPTGPVGDNLPSFQADALEEEDEDDG